MSTLTFDQYQDSAIKTKTYLISIDKFINSLGIESEENKARLRKTLTFLYVTLGLVGEAGEVAEKMKKIIRDGNCEITDQNLKELSKENGDVLWYNTAIADESGYKIGDVARENIEKLADRQLRGVLSGSGDNR